jgi:hypothetical protein
MMDTDFEDADSYDAPLDDDHNYYAGNSNRNSGRGRGSVDGKGGGVVFLGTVDPSYMALDEELAPDVELEERKKTHSERVQTFRQVCLCRKEGRKEGMKYPAR